MRPGAAVTAALCLAGASYAAVAALFYALGRAHGRLAGKP